MDEPILAISKAWTKHKSECQFCFNTPSYDNLEQHRFVAGWGAHERFVIKNWVKQRDDMHG